jgi:hypothetical protein
VCHLFQFIVVYSLKWSDIVSSAFIYVIMTMSKTEETIKELWRSSSKVDPHKSNSTHCRSLLAVHSESLSMYWSFNCTNTLNSNDENSSLKQRKDACYLRYEIEISLRIIDRCFTRASLQYAPRLSSIIEMAFCYELLCYRQYE